MVVRGGDKRWWQGMCVLLLRCACVGWVRRLMVGCGGSVWCYGCDLVCVEGIFVIPGLVVGVGWALGFGLIVGFPV